MVAMMMSGWEVLCAGNPSTQTSTYSGTVTTTSQQNLVLLTPSTIWPKQCVAILSFSTKRRITLGRHSPNANTLNGFWTMWGKGLTGSSGRLLMGLTTRALQAPSPLSMELKPRSDCYTLHTRSLWKNQEDLWEVWHTDPVQSGNTNRNLLHFPKDKDPMVNKVGPYIGSIVVTLPVRMNT